MRKFICLLICSVLASCSVNTVKLSTQYEHQVANSKKDELLKSIEECSYHLNEYSDSRESKSLGIVALTIVESDVNEWALSALRKHNIDSENIETHPKVKVTLLKAYIHSLMTSMAANVVFKIEYTTEDIGTKNVKYVRGHEVDVNWNSGEGEILATLNKAMGKAIANARVELDKLYCT